MFWGEEHLYLLCFLQVVEAEVEEEVKSVTCIIYINVLSDI